MKRKDLEKYLSVNGCFLAREDGSHSIFRNPENGMTTSVPRHREINNLTVKGICKHLQVPLPEKY